MTVRTQIINAVVARLQTVRQANGYRTEAGATVKLNYDKATEAFAADETLGYSVRDIGGQDMPGMASENACTLELEINVVAKSTEAIDASEIVRIAHADMFQAIGTDKTFDGLCDDFVTGAADYADVQRGQAAATITQHCKVNFRTARWNPNVSLE